MKRVLRTSLLVHWPLLVGLAALAALVVLLYLQCLAQTADGFVYPLDDTYIHMAMARTLVEHGGWGVTHHSFGSSSSSLLWTPAIAAGFGLAGGRLLVPLALALACGVAAVATAYVLARRENVPAWLNAVGLVALTWAATLAPMVLSGMEHACQILIDLLFLYVACRTAYPSSGAALAGRPSGWLFALAAAVTLIRFEGLFLVFVVCVLFALRRRWLLAGLLGVTALAPVLVYGCISLANGGFFLPNSVLLKGATPSFGSWMEVADALGLLALRRLWHTPHLAGPLVLAAWLLVVRASTERAQNQFTRALLLVAVATTLLHVQFAQLGWFYRYEAYLIALLLFSLVLRLSACLPSLTAGQTATGWEQERLARAAYAGAALLLGVAMIAPVVRRGHEALLATPLCSADIHDQQIQMSRFLHRYYDGQAVAANDIGAISYFADISLLDLYGLDGMEVAWHKRRGTYTPQVMADLARRQGVKIALVYDSWFQPYGGLPSEWVKVGSWQVRDAVVLGGAEVSFYAVDPVESGPLTGHLKEFALGLPARVSQQTCSHQARASNGENGAGPFCEREQ